MAVQRASTTAPVIAALLLLLPALMLSSTAWAARPLGGSIVELPTPFSDPPPRPWGPVVSYPPPQNMGQASSSPPPPRPAASVVEPPYIIQVPSGRPGFPYHHHAPPPETYWPSAPSNYRLIHRNVRTR
ncbi:uncharacterized protein [Miscanthus floridulus]|uniref:uncharacterized protein n=1 Tax=Miscanthus floridulus TaxID=154761 RepID=UPI0034579A76